MFLQPKMTEQLEEEYLPHFNDMRAAYSILCHFTTKPLNSLAICYTLRSETGEVQGKDSRSYLPFKIGT